MTSLLDHDIESFSAELQLAGLSPSHAPRILRSYYAGTLDALRPRLGKRIAAWLDASCSSPRSSIRHRSPAADGTVKLLIAFARGGFAESVLMPGKRPDRAAVCVSSQIGCAMRCDFCASTRNGLERDLDAGEIAAQFLHLRREAAAAGRRVASLVFMGMGEPLSNLSQVIPAIRRIADPNMGGLGWRQITVSTVGLVPGIVELADADLNVHLALSLHAPDDETRSRLVPVNRRYPVKEVIAAARSFYERTGRIVTIEYCMLAGINDSIEQADLLIERMNGFRAHVNLIPYNPIGSGISGVAYERPTAEVVEAFMMRVRNGGLFCNVRVTRGDDVDAACGQLRINDLARTLPVISVPMAG